MKTSLFDVFVVDKGAVIYCEIPSLLPKMQVSFEKIMVEGT
jgi:hypothetical protein